MEIEPSHAIDLRSDTVTQPCEGMRKAMSRAEVGDDVNGDDPTVIRLQEKVSGLLGMEAGLFVPSGTMANAVAIRTYTQPGDEIVAEEQSHLYVYEGGGYAALSGCSIALVRGNRGILMAQEVEKNNEKQKEAVAIIPMPLSSALKIPPIGEVVPVIRSRFWMKSLSAQKRMPNALGWCSFIQCGGRIRIKCPKTNTRV